MIFSVNISFAAAGGNAAYDGAFGLLSGLGIVTGYPDGSFHGEYNITRAEFAALICRLNGAEDAAKNYGGQNRFNDISADDWYVGYANYAAGAGFMVGYGENIFGGSDNVTYNQAIKTVVCLLGYGSAAEQSGGYPNGYLTLAKNLKILKNVKTGDNEALRGDVAILIANSLSAYIAEVSYGDENKVKIGTKTLVSELGYDVFTGVVESVPGISSDSGTDISADEIMIGGKVYKNLMGDASHLFGLTVEFYVDCDSSKSRPHIVYAYATDGGGITIDADDITSVASGKIEYTENDRDKTADISNARVIYNGRPLMTSDIEGKDLTPKDGSVTLIDSDKSGGYEMVVIWEYTDITFKSMSDDCIYGKYQRSVKLPENSTETSTLIYYNKNLISRDELITGDVLSAYPSKDGKALRIIVSRSSAEGRFSAADDDYYYLDGKDKYELSGSYKELVESSEKRIDAPVLGDNVRFYLNAYGKIADSDILSEDGGGEKYGFLVAISEPSGISSETSFKILNTDNEYITVKIKDGKKIKFGRSESGSYNVTRLSSDEVYNALNGDGKFAAQLVKYNADNEILTEIYLADTTGSGTVWDASVTASERGSFSGKLFIDKYIVDDETYAFYAPTNAAEDDYRSGNAMKLMTNGSTYRLMLYDIKNRHADCVVISPILSTTTGNKYFISKANDPLMLVTGFGSMNASDGNEYKYIRGYVNGEEKDVLVRDNLENNSDDFAELKNGTVIQYKMNSDEKKYASFADNPDYMIMYKKVADLSGNVSDSILWNGEGVEMTNAVMRTLIGTINYIDGDNVIIDVGGEQYPIVLTDYATVLEYDSGRKQTEKSSSDELAEGKRVFVRQRYNNTREIIVLK